MKKNLRDSKGSITVYTLVSMAFFLTVSIGIYTNTNNKVQEQDKQIQQIQESYEKQDDINSIYQQTYEKIKHIKTPTINVYGQENLIATVNGDKVNKIKTIYTHYENVTLKFSSNLSGYEYGYSTTKDGEKIVGNEININVTEDGTTIYSYLKDVSTGEYFDKYTAIVIKLTSLDDKEIYLAEGTSKEINVTGNKNIGDITYSDISDSTIASVTENKTLNGLTAGTATIKAIESKGGATATVTAKVTRIELEEQQGIMLIDDSKILEVSGVNHGALDVELSDSSIATVSIQGNTLNIKTNKVGKTTITITELNGGATTSYILNVVDLSLSPDGGNYLLPSDGTNATIKTTVVSETAEKIEYSWGTESGQEAWTEIESGTILAKSDCIGNEEYYIYIRIDEEIIYKSNLFIINGTTNKITIVPDETEWTNQDIKCTISYPEESVNSTRKSAYGSSLENATTNSNSATAPTTSVIVSENGYVYAEATDIAGNKVTASLPILNIDKEAPICTVIAGETNWTNQDVTLTGTSQDTGSGLVAFGWTTTATEPTGTTTTGELGKWTSITKTTEQINEAITLNSNGTRYFWTKDEIGNVNSATITMSKIDKLDPNTFTPTATSTINTITVTASTTDQEATTKYGKSDIAGYRFRINGGEWSDYQASGIYPFTGLAQATSYKVEVEAKDNAGNTTPGTVTISTKEVTLSLAYTEAYFKKDYNTYIPMSGDNLGTLTVSSSNSTIATGVLSGTSGLIVYAKEPGKAVITVTPSNNINKAVTFTVYVTSLTAPSTTSHTLEIGGTVTLTAPTKSTYAGTITYTSSNTGVATVTSSGVVTAVAGGTATITAREGNGGATVTYTIKVNKNKLLATLVEKETVKKGDYVNYPVGYSNVSAYCGASSSDTGWRVLYVKDNCVYLVSQSDPLGYWGKTFSSALTTSGLYNWLYTYSNFTGYVNSTYASEARGLLKTDLDTYNGSTLNNGSTYSNNLIKNGTYYYFGNNYLGVTGQVSSSGKITENAELQSFIANPSDYNACIGIRVVVKLNSNVRTTGQNSSGVWQITTSTGN